MPATAGQLSAPLIRTLNGQGTQKADRVERVNEQLSTCAFVATLPQSGCSAVLARALGGQRLWVARQASKHKYAKAIQETERRQTQHLASTCRTYIDEAREGQRGRHWRLMLLMAHHLTGRESSTNSTDRRGSPPSTAATTGSAHNAKEVSIRSFESSFWCYQQVANNSAGTRAELCLLLLPRRLALASRKWRQVRKEVHLLAST